MNRSGSSDGEQDAENLETGISSSVQALHLKEPEDTSDEESHDGYEGQDVGFDEVGLEETRYQSARSIGLRPQSRDLKSP